MTDTASAGAAAEHAVTTPAAAGHAVTRAASAPLPAVDCVVSGAGATDLDIVVIGAGFAGIYALHRLRQAGLRARALERGDGVGGTWYWNRYPGARVDVEGFEYSFTFSPELDAEWDWQELMPAQPELERYLNHVVDRFDLRGDIELATTVVAMDWSEDELRWTVRTAAGQVYRAPFVLAATGCLSEPLTPQIDGIESFAGDALFTNRFPADGYDFTGKRVGVVGTGSSGVQCIPVIAETAGSLHVFQRSAAFTRPANNRRITPEEMAERRAGYPELRQRMLTSFSGTLHFGAVSLPDSPPVDRILDTPMAARLQKIEEQGWGAAWDWGDLMVDIEANRAGVDLYGEVLKRHVADPATASALRPHYPLGCKRLIIDTDYYATFNKPNVTLVDLRTASIEKITPTGITTAAGHVELDVIVFATGFDAVTGALNRIDIRGRDGRLLRDVWETGPRTMLGLQVAGFPNLFTVTGPGSPSVHANMVVAIEQHVDWVTECIGHLRANGHRVIEPTEDAQNAWCAHVAEVASSSVRNDPSCNSWYTGANVPGKPKVYLAYLGGQPAYRARCDAIAAAGYEGFVLR
jgi:cation diffusion facilitator CzcD-associated flavoprotein CzcO